MRVEHGAHRQSDNSLLDTEEEACYLEEEGWGYRGECREGEIFHNVVAKFL